MLETETNMKNFSKIEKRINYDSKADHDADSVSHWLHQLKKFWFYDEDNETTRRCREGEKAGDPHFFCTENRIAKHHCH